MIRIYKDAYSLYFYSCRKNTRYNRLTSEQKTSADVQTKRTRVFYRAVFARVKIQLATSINCNIIITI